MDHTCTLLSSVCKAFWVGFVWVEAGFYMSTWFVCGSYCTFHIHIPRLFMGGYFLGVFFLNCFCFSAWGSFDPICCILELKSLFCMHFGARISHLRAHLAFGFWLWLRLALVLAVHFTWLLSFVSIVVCIYHFMLIHCIGIFHVNCTKTTDIEYRSLYACCCKKITKPSINKT